MKVIGVCKNLKPFHEIHELMSIGVKTLQIFAAYPQNVLRLEFQFSTYRVVAPNCSSAYSRQ